MTEIFDRLDRKKAKDLKVLTDFVLIYCREKHKGEDKLPFPVMDERLGEVFKGKNVVLCPECTKLLKHGSVKRLMCTQNPKPTCRKCRTHCYASGYREMMREVMRFSGMYLVRHGRLDLLLHYLK